MTFVLLSYDTAIVWPLDWRIAICWLRVSTVLTEPDTCCEPPPSTLPRMFPSPPALEHAPRVNTDAANAAVLVNRFMGHCLLVPHMGSNGGACTPILKRTRLRRLL